MKAPVTICVEIPSTSLSLGMWQADLAKQAFGQSIDEMLEPVMAGPPQRVRGSQGEARDIYPLQFPEGGEVRVAGVTVSSTGGQVYVSAHPEWDPWVRMWLADHLRDARMDSGPGVRWIHYELDLSEPLVIQTPLGSVSVSAGEK